MRTELVLGCRDVTALNEMPFDRFVYVWKQLTHQNNADSNSLYLSVNIWVGEGVQTLACYCTLQLIIVPGSS